MITDRWRVTKCDVRNGDPLESFEYVSATTYEWPLHGSNSVAREVAELWAEGHVRPTDYPGDLREVPFKVTVRPWQVSDARQAIRVIVTVHLMVYGRAKHRQVIEDAQWAAPL